MENLLKRHGDFEAKLRAQDERLKAFAKTADQMIQAGHRESPSIKQVMYFSLPLQLMQRLMGALFIVPP